MVKTNKRPRVVKHTKKRKKTKVAHDDLKSLVAEYILLSKQARSHGFKPEEIPVDLTDPQNKVDLARLANWLKPQIRVLGEEDSAYHKQYGPVNTTQPPPPATNYSGFYPPNPYGYTGPVPFYGDSTGNVYNGIKTNERQDYQDTNTKPPPIQATDPVELASQITAYYQWYTINARSIHDQNIYLPPLTAARERLDKSKIVETNSNSKMLADLEAVGLAPDASWDTATAVLAKLTSLKGSPEFQDARWQNEISSLEARERAFINNVNKDLGNDPNGKTCAYEQGADSNINYCPDHISDRVKELSRQRNKWQFENGIAWNGNLPGKKWVRDEVYFNQSGKKRFMWYEITPNTVTSADQPYSIIPRIY